MSYIGYAPRCTAPHACSVGRSSEGVVCRELSSGRPGQASCQPKSTHDRPIGCVQPAAQRRRQVSTWMRATVTLVQRLGKEPRGRDNSDDQLFTIASSKLL